MAKSLSHHRSNATCPPRRAIGVCSVFVSSLFTSKRCTSVFFLALFFHMVFSTITVAQAPQITVYGASWCGPCKTMKKNLGLNPTVFGQKTIDGIKVNFVDVDRSGWPGDVKTIPAMRVGDGRARPTGDKELLAEIEKIKNSKPRDEEEDNTKPEENPNNHGDRETDDDKPDDDKPKPDQPKPAPGGCGPGGCSPGGGSGGAGAAAGGAAGGALAGLGQMAMQALPQILQGVLGAMAQQQGSGGSQPPLPAEIAQEDAAILAQVQAIQTAAYEEAAAIAARDEGEPTPPAEALVDNTQPAQPQPAAVPNTEPTRDPMIGGLS